MVKFISYNLVSLYKIIDHHQQNPEIEEIQSFNSNEVNLFILTNAAFKSTLKSLLCIII